LIAALAVIAAFFIGSIPFGYVIGRVFYGIDLRTKGSGNIGAANALRTIGPAGAAAVLFLDALKGFAPVLTARVLGAEPTLVAGVACATVVGHCFSPSLGWRGGKGVATSVGATIALSWIAGAASAATWGAAVLITGFSSVGSILADIAAPIGLWYATHERAYAAYGIFVAAFIIYTHRENIARLRQGRENAIGPAARRRRRDEGN